MPSSSILQSAKQQIKDCWLSGMTLSEVLSLCPDDTDVRSFVTIEYLDIHGKLLLSRVNPEDYIKRLQ